MHLEISLTLLYLLSCNVFQVPFSLFQKAPKLTKEFTKTSSRKKNRISNSRSVLISGIFYHLFWEQKRSLDLTDIESFSMSTFFLKVLKIIVFFYRCPYLHRTAGDTERRYHLKYYKTGMCVHDTDNRGFCVKNGPHCAFAHGANDLRPAVYDIR